MMKFTDEEIASMVAFARTKIQKGGQYWHVNGNTYIAIDIVILQETVEPMVLYRREDKEDIFWVRPLERFLERFEKKK